jgi:hypothetical protein
MNQATNIGTVEAALRRSEREKDLEKQVPCLDLPLSLSASVSSSLSCCQLVKAKRDKDKSLKLLIQIIGKVREGERGKGGSAVDP